METNPYLILHEMLTSTAERLEREMDAGKRSNHMTVEDLVDIFREMAMDLPCPTE